MIQLIFLSGAGSDFDELHARFEEQGRGDAFYAAVDLELNLLRLFPALHPESLDGKVRKARIARTPYALFTSIKERAF